MESIIFKGKVGSGVGLYVELHVPGKEELPQAPEDWPNVLCEGSLNIYVEPDGYPKLFDELGLSRSAKSLDQKPIECSFEIGQAEFGNNKLTPTDIMPERGSAQVWRAILALNGEKISCWVVRRYGSGLQNQLEIVSDVHLRTEYSLMDGQEVELCLYP